MQYRRTHMNVELTEDYEILSINGVGKLLMEIFRRQVNVDGASARRRNFNWRYLQDKSI